MKKKIDPLAIAFLKSKGEGKNFLVMNQRLCKAEDLRFYQKKPILIIIELNYLPNNLGSTIKRILNEAKYSCSDLNI
jgi:hypothetical protein